MGKLFIHLCVLSLFFAAHTISFAEQLGTTFIDESGPRNFRATTNNYTHEQVATVKQKFQEDGFASLSKEEQKIFFQAANEENSRIEPNIQSLAKKGDPDAQLQLEKIRVARENMDILLDTEEAKIATSLGNKSASVFAQLTDEEKKAKEESTAETTKREELNRAGELTKAGIDAANAKRAAGKVDASQVSNFDFAVTMLTNEVFERVGDSGEKHTDPTTPTEDTPEAESNFDKAQSNFDTGDFSRDVASTSSSGGGDLDISSFSIPTSFTAAATGRLLNNARNILNIGPNFSSSFSSTDLYNSLPKVSRVQVNQLISDILKGDARGTASEVDPLMELLKVDGFQQAAAQTLGEDALTELNMSVIAAEIINSPNVTSADYLVALAAVQNTSGLQLSDLYPPVYNLDGSAVQSDKLSECAASWVRASNELSESSKLPKKFQNVDKKRLGAGQITLGVLLLEFKKFKSMDLLCKVEAPMPKEAFPNLLEVQNAFLSQIDSAVTDLDEAHKESKKMLRSIGDQEPALLKKDIKGIELSKAHLLEAKKKIKGNIDQSKSFINIYNVFKSDKARYYWRKHSKATYLVARRVASIALFDKFFKKFSTKQDAERYPLFYLVKVSKAYHQYKVDQENAKRHKNALAKGTRTPSATEIKSLNNDLGL